MRTLYVVAWTLILFCACSRNESSKVEVSDQQGRLREVYFLDRDSLRQGLSWSFYPGTLDTFERSSFLNGQLHGQRKLFYENGITEIEENYENGTLTGEVRTYHPNGVLAFMATYSNDVLSGTVQTYYPSGVLKETVSFSNNEENGPFTEYHPNGKKSWEGIYLHGENEVGELLQYDTSGTLVRKMWCDSLSICRTQWKKENADIVTQ